MKIIMNNGYHQIYLLYSNVDHSMFVYSFNQVCRGNLINHEKFKINYQEQRPTTGGV